MALQLKAACERCGNPLAWDGIAFVCSYECTFCRECVVALAAECPNCGGELVRRPRRTTSFPAERPFEVLDWGCAER